MTWPSAYWPENRIAGDPIKPAVNVQEAMARAHAADAAYRNAAAFVRTLREIRALAEREE